MRSILFLQSGVCRLLHSGQCVNLWAFGSYSGVLPQVSCFILFSVVTVSIIRIFIEFLVVYVVCVLVCPFLGLLSCMRHGREGLSDYVLFIGCLPPLVAGVPFSLGSSHLPLQCRRCRGITSSGGFRAIGLIEYYPASTPHFISTGVIRVYLSHAGTPQGLPSQSGLSLSVLGTGPCMTGAEDPGGGVGIL